MSLLKPFNWKEQNVWNKFIYCIGWINAFTIYFWLIMCGYNFFTGQDKFWNGDVKRIIQLFGYGLFFWFLFWFGYGFGTGYGS